MLIGSFWGEICRLIEVPEIVIILHVAGVPFPLIGVGEADHFAVGFRVQKVCDGLPSHKYLFRFSAL